MIEIKCVACKRGFLDSEVVAKSYKIESAHADSLIRPYILQENMAVRPQNYIDYDMMNEHMREGSLGEGMLGDEILDLGLATPSSVN